MGVGLPHHHLIVTVPLGYEVVGDPKVSHDRDRGMPRRVERHNRDSGSIAEPPPLVGVPLRPDLYSDLIDPEVTVAGLSETELFGVYRSPPPERIEDRIGERNLPTTAPSLSR